MFRSSIVECFLDHIGYLRWPGQTLHTERGQQTAEWTRFLRKQALLWGHGLRQDSSGGSYKRRSITGVH